MNYEQRWLRGACALAMAGLVGACGTSTGGMVVDGGRDGASGDGGTTAMDAGIVPPGMDATVTPPGEDARVVPPGEDAGGTFCARALCAAGTTCCEVSRSCLPVGVPCPPEMGSDGGAPRMCGSAICGADQQCCTTPAGPICLPSTIPCGGRMDGGMMGGTCGGMTCSATQVCCSALGFMRCVDPALCPTGTDGGTGPRCGAMTCSVGQDCCTTGLGPVCVPAGRCPTGADGGTGPRCGASTCTSMQECCGTVLGQFCVPIGRCPGGGGTDAGTAADSGTSFCATARCAAGNFCCEARRACVPNSETCSTTPPPMCAMPCMRGTQCCSVAGTAVCLPRCPTDPCAGVTCGDGYACCGVGMNTGRCTARACLACCM